VAELLAFLSKKHHFFCLDASFWAQIAVFPPVRYRSLTLAANGISTFSELL
jgi:hypothetical protein